MAGDEAVRRLREAVEGLDVGVLVNNAGVAKPCALYLHEVDVEAWVSDHVEVLVTELVPAVEDAPASEDDADSLVDGADA